MIEAVLVNLKLKNMMFANKKQRKKVWRELYEETKKYAYFYVLWHR